MALFLMHEYAEVYSLKIAYGMDYQLQWYGSFAAGTTRIKIFFFGYKRDENRQPCAFTFEHSNLPYALATCFTYPGAKVPLPSYVVADKSGKVWSNTICVHR
ncbi:BA75_04312T0 [Komagataella pastoris]|uniref:BA75_04312T0 n=1 Tax=Komagataella pastoris TaxID=4922 RepID=A0A1B2JFC1_PICPA|nr:BA75_04312T0 [Komagataella pastoris]